VPPVPAPHGDPPPGPGAPALDRRRFLGAAGALALALVGLDACSSPDPTIPGPDAAVNKGYVVPTARATTKNDTAWSKVPGQLCNWSGGNSQMWAWLAAADQLGIPSTCIMENLGAESGYRPGLALADMANRLRDILAAMDQGPGAPGPRGVVSSYSVPLSGITTLQEVADGAADASYQAVARELADGGLVDRSILRIGWEFDGYDNGHPWMGWGAYGRERLFAVAFRRVVGIFKDVDAGFVVDLCWAGEHVASATKVVAACGDLCDIISIDAYQGTAASRLATTLAWCKRFGTSTALPEWGMAGQRDDPRYVDLLVDWVNGPCAAAGVRLAYANVFNTGLVDAGTKVTKEYGLFDSSGLSKHYPKAAARYVDRTV